MHGACVLKNKDNGDKTALRFLSQREQPQSWLHWHAQFGSLHFRTLLPIKNFFHRVYCLELV